MSERHPLAGVDMVRLAELRDEEWVSAPAGSFEHELLGHLCRHVDFDPVVRYRCAELTSRLSLLHNDLVLGIGSPLVMRVPGLTAIPFDVTPTQRLILGWDPTLPDSLAHGIIDCVVDCYRGQANGVPAYLELISTRPDRFPRLLPAELPAAVNLRGRSVRPG